MEPEYCVYHIKKKKLKCKGPFCLNGPTGPTGAAGPFGPTGPTGSSDILSDQNFSARNNIGQVIPSGNKDVIIFDTVEYNVGGGYNGTNTFTAPVTGKYHFQTSLAYTSTDTLIAVTLSIESSNGITQNWVDRTSNPDGDEITKTGVVVLDISLLAGDTVSVYVTNNTDSNLTLSTLAPTRFSGFSFT